MLAGLGAARRSAMTLGGWFELIASGVITGGIYALVALGLNLQYGLMRILNVAHGEFLMLGAFVTWTALTLLQISPLAMLPVTFVLMMALGLLVHRLVFRRLTRTSANLDVFEARGLMVCFGLMFLVQQQLVGGELRAANKLLLLALALVISGVLIAWLRFTLMGKAVRALMQSPTGAQLVGIDIERLHPLMFGIGLGLSGVAGCLLSMAYTISPSMGEPYTVSALIVITLGGFGSMTGSLVGGLALGVIEAIGTDLTSPSLKALLSYSVFIAVLLWRPNGLFKR